MNVRRRGIRSAIRSLFGSASAQWRLLLQHCREGDDLSPWANGSEYLGGTLAVEAGEFVVEDDEVRLFLKRHRNRFDAVRCFSTTSKSSDSHSSLNT